MATRAYIIPRRNDVGGMGIQVLDLRPNSSLRNVPLEGEGQTFYLQQGMDQPGVTTLIGGLYASGSTNTAPLAAVGDADTDGQGGADSDVTQATEYGLAAYLRERVNADPGNASVLFTAAEAVDAAAAIYALVEAGSPLTSAGLAAALSSVVAGTDLDGTVVNGSASYGTVEEVLRILSGEVYVVPAKTILGTNAGVFQSLADRTAKANATYGAAGHFLVAGEPGFRRVKPILLAGDVRASAAEGNLAGLKRKIQFRNPRFDYTGGVTALPQAKDIAGNALVDDASTENLDEAGVHEVVAVYDAAGNVL